MTVSDNTIQAEELVNFFKNLRKIFAEAGEKKATNVLKNPGWALEINSNIATAATEKAALPSLTEVIKVYHKGKGSYIGQFV